MAKNFLNDIRPMGQEEKSRRTIESKPLPASDRPINLPPKFIDRSFSEDTGRRSSRKIWVIALLVLVVAGIAVSSLFSTAQVTITPKSNDISFENSLFSAVLNGADTSLTFKIVKASGSAEKVATASAMSDQNTKATGRVIIYNGYSTVPQKLTIETRLVTNDGKIYKTDVATVVPGSKTVGGKMVPGSVEVGVHADVAGPSYNIGLSDFSILGFKGTPKYAKFYARGKTPISGGMTGKQYVLSEAEAKIAHEAAFSALTDKLKNDVKGNLPEDALFLPGAYVIKETPGPTTYSGPSEKVPVEVKGTLIGVLFNRQELTQKIAEANIHNFDKVPVTISELPDFTVDIKNKDTLSETTATLSFALSGKGIVVWDIDEAKVLEALAGAKKKDVTVKLAGFPSILKASVKLSPLPWGITLPKDKTKIHLLVEKPIAQ